ncbi:MAG: 4'-phosphopantetheinyl transferase superfamily protein [Xanthomonadales bacterium]|nr:hypothetical protein [Xanthomonadales bacterium]MCC6591690.1 4'-phosphopantetheinyl transferase superfamily protein [Xanthomonadales bacterium]
MSQVPHPQPESGHVHLHWWRLPPLADTSARSRWVWTQVRTCLASRAGIAATDLEIRRSANGKPLAPQLPFAFSLAHDDDVALLALTAGGMIGVDVLGARALANPQRLARRLYATHELMQWQTLAAEQRLRQLRTRFCVIEAVVKALDWRLWSGLGNIHFLRQGRIARVPVKRAQLHLASGEREGYAWGVATDTEAEAVTHHAP